LFHLHERVQAQSRDAPPPNPCVPPRSTLDDKLTGRTTSDDERRRATTSDDERRSGDATFLYTRDLHRAPRKRASADWPDRGRISGSHRAVCMTNEISMECHSRSRNDRHRSPFRVTCTWDHHATIGRHSSRLGGRDIKAHRDKRRLMKSNFFIFCQNSKFTKATRERSEDKICSFIFDQAVHRAGSFDSMASSKARN